MSYKCSIKGLPTAGAFSMAVPQGFSSGQQGQEYFLSEGVNGIPLLYLLPHIRNLWHPRSFEALDPFLMEIHALRFLWKSVKINPTKCGAGGHKRSTEMIGRDIGKTGERKGSSNSWCLIPVGSHLRWFLSLQGEGGWKKSNNPGNLFCASMEAAGTKF